MARKILLADDSVTAQNMGRRILSDAGYDVTTVNNGSAALKKIAESKPDLIVLDVYMPGYGGLEVCQRLREAPETARIPVLLTVGKLEPFKADEARRVRADAFIVKPFEASELLTALAKLEDKIVPQAQPSKPGRFAKAMAAADDFAPGKDFGNSETGWKNRLSIPPPHAKHRESEPDEPPAAAASIPDAVKTEEHPPAEMKSGLEEALLSSLPQDVTAEEIAAIKAAAAAFSAPSDASTLRMQPVMDQASTPESAASAENVADATFASASEPQAEALPESVSAAQAESSLPAFAEPVSAVDAPGEAPALTVSDPAARAVSQDAGAENRNLAEDEVTAALASLAPANGNGDAAAIDGEPAKWGIAARDQVPVMAAAAATQEFNGPRWIAEPASVMEEEALLILDQEMERAYASFAAADAARMSLGSSPAEPYFSSPVAEASSNSGTSSPIEAFSIPDSTESKPPEQTTAVEVPAALPATDAVSESTVAEAKETSAYAAAASAGAGASEAPMAAEIVSQPTPSVESSESVPPVPEAGERQGESELAAAWANWRQIRESVVGSQLVGSQIDGSQLVGSQIDASQLSSQIADTVAELKPNSPEAQPDSQSDVSSATGEEATEISNIVDSVLADLKPRLMAEIAKKMGKDSKKK